MRLVTYSSTDHQTHAGLVDSGVILDIDETLKWLNLKPISSAKPIEILEVIQDQATFLPLLQRILAAKKENKLPEKLLKPETQVKLHSPIPRPLSMRDGYAFRQHVEAARRNRGVPMIPEFDHFPVFYFTNHLAVTGPGEIAVQKLAREKLDFELEVAIVVGKQCRNVSAADADSYIFGYMVMNDWSARALQMEEMKLNLGPAKGKDFATSLGPYLVTRDEL